MGKPTRETALLDEPEAAHQAETAALVAERGTTHGDWDAHATCVQDLKDELSTHLRKRSRPLTAMQLEALHMILHKIGRIVAGDPNFKDHWDDIAGYAKITADRL